MDKIEKQIAKRFDKRMAKVTILIDKMNPEELTLLTKILEINRMPFQPHKDYKTIYWNDRKKDAIRYVYFNGEEYVFKIVEKNQTILLKILGKRSACANQ